MIEVKSVSSSDGPFGGSLGAAVPPAAVTAVFSSGACFRTGAAVIAGPFAPAAAGPAGLAPGVAAGARAAGACRASASGIGFTLVESSSPSAAPRDGSRGCAGTVAAGMPAGGRIAGADAVVAEFAAAGAAPAGAGLFL